MGGPSGRAGMLCGMEQGRQFGTVTLIQGAESLLAERAVAERVAAARAERPGASLSTLAAVGLDAGALAEATGGSLFASDQIVVIEGIDSVPAELTDAVAALAAQPVDDLVLLLVHPGGVKGKGLVDRLKKARVEVVECAPIKAWQLPQFAMAEARRAGGRLDQATATILAEALGTDVRGIVGAVKQLLDDSDDGVITEKEVRRYFAGRADITSFTVADAVMAGRRDEALGALRWALDNGTAPVLISSAVASSLRNLGRFLDARQSRLRDAEMARVVGVPPWKIKDLQRQSRDWTERGLAASIATAARVDAEIKGAASDAGFSLEQLVIEVSAQRGRHDSASR